VSTSTTDGGASLVRLIVERAYKIWNGDLGCPVHNDAMQWFVSPATYRMLRTHSQASRTEPLRDDPDVRGGILLLGIPLFASDLADGAQIELRIRR
jgi:hypothetical protein